MMNSRATAMPMPAPTPAVKWLFDVFELEGEVVGEVIGKVAGKTRVEDIEELEVVAVACANAEKLEVVTAAIEEEFGRIVEEVIASRKNRRDEVWQQAAIDQL